MDPTYGTSDVSIPLLERPYTFQQKETSLSEQAQEMKQIFAQNIKELNNTRGYTLLATASIVTVLAAYGFAVYIAMYDTKREMGDPNRLMLNSNSALFGAGLLLGIVLGRSQAISKFPIDKLNTLLDNISKKD